MLIDLLTSLPARAAGSGQDRSELPRIGVRRHAGAVTSGQPDVIDLAMGT